MRLLLPLIAMSTLSAASAEGLDPDTFASLLKVGTRVAIINNHEAGTFSVTVYSPEVFDMAKDSSTMSSDELDEKYPKLAAAKQREIARSTASLKERRDELPQGKAFDTPKAQLRVYSKARLCIVTHVGNDYFIVTDGGENARRTAYSMRYVASIGWQDDIPVAISVSYVDQE